MGVTVWEHSTDSPNVAYPDSMAAPGGRKGLSVGGAGPRGGRNPWLSSAPTLLSGAIHHCRSEAAVIPIDQLLWATMLENGGYYAESADYLRELREAHPEDIRLTRHLAYLYWNAGLILRGQPGTGEIGITGAVSSRGCS